MQSNKLAAAIAQASKTKQVELAPFFANNLDTAGHARGNARARDHVAALDRFAAPKQGERF